MAGKYQGMGRVWSKNRGWKGQGLGFMPDLKGNVSDSSVTIN